TVGVQFPNAGTQWLASGTTDANGKFDVSVPIGKRSIGSQFSVIAAAQGGVQATSANRVTVVALPRLQISPSSGPIGTAVTLTGTGWRPNRAVNVGIRPGDSRTVNWSPNPVVSNAAGNFSIVLSVGSQYGRQSQVFMVA